ncbi:hypothetical protein B0J17DRAFT_771503 [Rhizoctonia solani]|nr:hypothetical protein B0J17DRAFT_771503 [Rhizoctonia solani]
MAHSLKLPTAQSSTIPQWEEAGVLLATAVSRFFDLSTLLESRCTIRDKASSDLVALIEPPLNYFQSSLERQLTQAPSRIWLTETRNRLGRSILSLPQKNVSEIFLLILYDPTDEDKYDFGACALANEDMNVTDKLTLSKLKSLRIGDLYFNIFAYFMKALVRPPSHFTFSLLPTFPTMDYISSNHCGRLSGVADRKAICGLLRTADINKLIIIADDESHLWSSATGLQAVLKSIPKAKPLIMSFSYPDEEMLKAFKQPPRPRLGNPRATICSRNLKL